MYVHCVRMNEIFPRGNVRTAITECKKRMRVPVEDTKNTRSRRSTSREEKCWYSMPINVTIYEQQHIYSYIMYMMCMCTRFYMSIITIIGWFQEEADLLNIKIYYYHVYNNIWIFSCTGVYYTQDTNTNIVYIIQNVFEKDRESIDALTSVALDAD